jgi:O-antigen ligase
LPWVATHAHNTYLQIFLELGLVGVGLVLFFTVFAIFKIISLWREQPVPASLCMALLILYIVQSVFESVLLRTNIMFYFIICLLPLISTIKLQRNKNVGINKPISAT